MGHTEWMLDENETFQALSAKLSAWIEERVREEPPRAYTIARQQSSRAAVSGTGEHRVSR